MPQIQTTETAKNYRSYTFSMRLTPAEHERLDELAGRLTYSEYARERLFGEHAVKRLSRNRYPVKDHAELSRLLAWLGASRTANNLNQIARAVNCGAVDLPPERQEMLRAACHDIASIKTMLTSALGLRA